MTHYEERLETDLAKIRERLDALSGLLQENVAKSVRALLHLDRDAAAEVILHDHPINRLKREIEALCHVFVARHLPSAGILRYISSVLRLAVELERVGDYAVSIGRETVQLSKPLPQKIARDIEMLAEQGRTLLEESIRAFREGNAEQARSTKTIAARAETSFDKVYADLIDEGERGARPMKDIFALLATFSRLDRIADQAKNICEETLFAVAGEVKQPKVYKILFLDGANDFRSQMAQAIARKGFPESGEYASAGWSAAEGVRPEVHAFLDRHGHKVDDLEPHALSRWEDEIAEMHVIVALEPGAREHLQVVPFHTVLVQWDVEPDAGPDDGPLDDERLDRVYRALAGQIGSLMEMLRGEQAH